MNCEVISLDPLEVDPLHFKEVLKLLLHSVVFQRALGEPKFKDVNSELFAITYVRCDSALVERTVEDETEKLSNALADKSNAEGNNTQTIQIRSLSLSHTHTHARARARARARAHTPSLARSLSRSLSCLFSLQHLILATCATSLFSLQHLILRTAKEQWAVRFLPEGGEVEYVSHTFSSFEPISPICHTPFPYISPNLCLRGFFFSHSHKFPPDVAPRFSYTCHMLYTSPTPPPPFFFRVYWERWNMPILVRPAGGSLSGGGSLSREGGGSLSPEEREACREALEVGIDNKRGEKKSLLLTKDISSRFYQRSVSSFKTKHVSCSLLKKNLLLFF